MKNIFAGLLILVLFAHVANADCILWIQSNEHIPEQDIARINLTMTPETVTSSAGNWIVKTETQFNDYTNDPTDQTLRALGKAYYSSIKVYKNSHVGTSKLFDEVVLIRKDLAQPTFVGSRFTVLECSQ